MQTPEGYLWVGTQDGLARFDGLRFVNFRPSNVPELGHARIVKLFLDARGTLWINTYDGSLTSWRNGIFTREWDGDGKGISEAWLVSSNASQITFAFRSGLLIQRAVGGSPADWHLLRPPGNSPGAAYFEDHAGVLWCSTLDHHLWRIKDGQFELLPKDSGLRGQEIHWLSVDRSKRIWVGTEKEMARWDGERFQDMSPLSQGEVNVNFMFFTGDGGILVGSEQRVRKCRERQWVSEIKIPPSAFLESQQQLWPTTYEDREGGIWQITRGQGIIYSAPAGTVQQISVADGLPSDRVTCWFEDREGNIWVGLGYGGIARLRVGHFEVLGMPDGVPARPAMSVCEDRSGTLWVGTYGGGLNRWRQGALTNFMVPEQAPGPFIFSVYPDHQDRIWMSGAAEDSFVFENGELRPAPVAVHAIKSLLVDQKGRIWMGRKDGAVCWAEGKLSEWNSTTGLIAKPVRALAEDVHGVIWMGADNGTVYHFEEGAPQPLRLPEFPNAQAVWSLLPDADGSLWIGTSDAGLLHLEQGRFTRFTAQDGLLDNAVCQILDDRLGNLWVGTHHGIGRVSKAALAAFASGKATTFACSNYGRPDGLPTLRCSSMYQPSAWRGQNGKLWFATGKGVVGVSPGEVPVNTRRPSVVIEEFVADGKIQPITTGGGPRQGSPLKVSPGTENFEFRYTALSLVDAEKVLFRYKLEGFDANWVNAGTRRWVQYSYLKPGTYRFRVAACNNDGLWNEKGVGMSLKILPHFWETWWFFALLAVILVSGASGTARYISHRSLRRAFERLERHRDIEQDRARIARDIHDHIGSGLTRINLLNELLLGEAPELLPGRVAQITGVTCELMRTMDEIVWAVNPKNDTLDSLMSYICDFADEYLHSAGIRLRLNLPDPLPAWYLPSEVRHNLFLAMKEILNNIVKHARATAVTFDLKLDANVATLEIQDNGQGFAYRAEGLVASPGHQSPAGNGLENLQKRATAIGGQCLISSALEKGTRVQIVVPKPVQ